MEKDTTEFEGTEVNYSYTDLLHSNSSDNVSLIEPRDYQKFLINFAVKQNTIIFLDTGLGKTLIAIYVIKHIFNENASVNKLNPEYRANKETHPSAKKVF